MRVVFAALLLALAPARSLAQSPGPPPHRIELAAGIGFLGGVALGDANADLRSGASNDPYRLFTTSSQFRDARVVDLRAAFDISRRFGVEAHVLFGQPELHTEISSDAESAPALTAVERVDHYLVDGGIIFRLDEFNVKGFQPFITAGAGYLRQLHEGRTVIETGRLFYAGAGARYWIFTRARGIPRAGGLRADVRLNVLSGGVEIEDRARRQPSISGSFFLLF
jgi:hypothetical protein